jgi:hypothetical protein
VIYSDVCCACHTNAFFLQNPMTDLSYETEPNRLCRLVAMSNDDDNIWPQLSANCAKVGSSQKRERFTKPATVMYKTFCTVLCGVPNLTRGTWKIRVESTRRQIHYNKSTHNKFGTPILCSIFYICFIWSKNFVSVSSCCQQCSLTKIINNNRFREKTNHILS